MKRMVKIFGVGSSRDRELMQSVRMAANELGLNVDIELISDIDVFLNSGISAIPAMVIGGRIVATGRIPAVCELKTLLRETTAAEGAA